MYIEIIQVSSLYMYVHIYRCLDMKPKNMQNNPAAKPLVILQSDTKIPACSLAASSFIELLP